MKGSAFHMHSTTWIHFGEHLGKASFLVWMEAQNKETKTWFRWIIHFSLFSFSLKIKQCVQGVELMAGNKAKMQLKKNADYDETNTCWESKLFTLGVCYTGPSPKHTVYLTAIYFPMIWQQDVLSHWLTVQNLKDHSNILENMHL